MQMQLQKHLHLHKHTQKQAAKSRRDGSRLWGRCRPRKGRDSGSFSFGKPCICKDFLIK
jgi:hypothetical protein